MSARDATQRLANVGLSPHLIGNGFVVGQDPPPGTPIDDGGQCRLTLARPPRRQSVSAEP
jgi:hypothetical protein